MDTAMALLEHRVITVPGSAFGSEGDGFLRLSYSIEGSLIEEGPLATGHPFWQWSRARRNPPLPGKQN